MSRDWLRYSLRQLLVVMTVVAIVLMLVSHHWRVVVGFVTVAVALLEVFYPVVEMLVGLVDPRSWRSLPERRPTKREIEKCAEEIAARYPTVPRSTTNSGDPSDSR